MADTFTGTAALSLSLKFVRDLDQNSPSDELSSSGSNTKFPAISTTLTDLGITQFYHAKSTLVAGGDDSYVLNGGGLLNTFGGAFNLTACYLSIVRIRTPGSGVKLTLGGAAVNPWLGWFSDTSDKINVKEWFVMPSTLDTVAVALNDTLLVHNPTAASIVYDIVFAGT